MLRVAVTVLQHVGAEDDQAVSPDGVFSGLERAERGTALEWKGERTLLHEGGVDFLAEGDPEGRLAEAGLTGDGGERIGDRSGGGRCGHCGVGWRGGSLVSGGVGFGGGEGDHRGAVWQGRNDGYLRVDEDVHDTKVEFVVGVVISTERGL